MRILLFSLLLTPGLGHAAGLGASSDICAVRPDLCDNDDASVAVLARQANRAAPARKPAALPSSAKPAAKLVVQSVALPSTRVSTCRPATVELTSSNQSLPVCGSALTPARAPAAATVAVQSVSFASYMNANGSNPALSRKISDYQSAFKNTAKPATFVAPDVEGNGTREGAAPTVASGNQ